MGLTELAGQAIVHALVAALVVEAVCRLWRLRAPDLRLRLRLLALAFPVLVLPAFSLLAPVRREEWFREEWALFAGHRWGNLDVGGVGLDVLAVSLLSALGLTLFLMDLLPFLAERLDGRGPASRSDSEETRAVAREVIELAGAMGIAPPPVLLLEGAAPVLFCAGVRRPTLVLSRGTLERLDGRERRAALAHEVGHLGRRDPLLGWILMAARSLMFFNPVVQVVARAAAQETEWRADDLAVRATGEPLALAAGLVKLFRVGGERSAPRRWRLAGDPLQGLLPARARTLALERRCRRLLDHTPPTPVRFARLRLVLTGLGLSVLLFFVV